MIAIPAVDLRGGACVQLVGGSYADERVRRPDPLEAAREWAAAGFRDLHVVDLDAATGRGSNAPEVHRLLRGSGMRLTVGGGVRQKRRVAELLAAGAQRVVVGTRAVLDPGWLTGVARQWPGRIVVAADVRGRALAIHGWQVTVERGPVALIAALAGLPLAGVLVTAVHREGLMQGPDLELMRQLAGQPLPLLASGGISSVDDLRALADIGVAGAVLGMALYTGALDPRAVAEEFAA